MELIIQSPHLTLNSELNKFVTEKVNKLSSFHNKIESANVCLKVENSDETLNKVCEIKLTVPGNELFAKRQCRSFEEATDQVVDALQHQINRIKK